jgi:DNA-binding response OmpR family regulator
VLIADGNRGRGRRLADACERSGIATRLASHGAAALEMALAHQPPVVVAEMDLPLVDASKLAEILGANPRTRQARFLYLGDEERLRGRARVGDQVMPVSCGPEELARRIIEVLERQDRIERVDETAEEIGMAEGDLAQLSVADLLQLFHMNQRSGRLVLRRDAEQETQGQGSIQILDGDVIRADVGITEGEKALFRLMAWSQGKFSFEPGRSSESPRIFAPTRALLVEGMRQLEEWDRLAPRLPPLDSPLKLDVTTADLPNIVHPLTQEVLLLLEIYPRVRDVVDHCSFPDYQVLRTLHTLSERGIVQIGRVPISGPVQMSEGLFNEAQARRLSDWLREESPRNGKPADAKLVVVASDPGAVVDFVNLMAATPQITLTPPRNGRKSTVPADVLGCIGRVEVDAALGIEIFHLPRDRRYAPLWPLAGHGALAVLFLLTGPVAAAAERVRELVEILRDVPKTRIFHVAMLRKDERISPDELRENAELIDDTPLYLMALEGDKEPAALLRGLLARVVP